MLKYGASILQNSSCVFLLLLECTLFVVVIMMLVGYSHQQLALCDKTKIKPPCHTGGCRNSWQYDTYYQQKKQKQRSKKLSLDKGVVFCCCHYTTGVELFPKKVHEGRSVR